MSYGVQLMEGYTMSANQDIQKYKESLKLRMGYNDYNGLGQLNLIQSCIFLLPGIYPWNT